MEKKGKKKLRIGRLLLFLSIVIVIVGAVFYLSYRILEPKENFNKEDERTEKNGDKKESKDEKIKLTIVGDLLFEQPYYDALASGDSEDKYFSLVKEYFLNDDLTIANMEVVIGDDTMQVSGTGYSFCAPQSIGKLVASSGFDVLSTANNHSYDRDVKGITSTLDFFKNNSNILTVGTNYKNDDTLKIKEINGIKVGFISYTSFTNVKIPMENRDLVNLFRDPDTKEMTDEYKEKIRKDVERYEDKVDVMIALIHWGNEFTYTPIDQQKELASFLNELGINIIVGSHAHSIQPIEWIGDEKKTLVYYGMGNFVSADYNITRTNETFNNAYQIGLLSTLEISKEDNEIKIDSINAEPIVNYYDTNLRNFLLIPFSKYSEEYETTHYRYKNNLNHSFIKDMYESVIDSQFRN